MVMQWQNFHKKTFTGENYIFQTQTTGYELRFIFSNLGGEFLKMSYMPLLSLLHNHNSGRVLPLEL